MHRSAHKEPDRADATDPRDDRAVPADAEQLTAAADTGQRIPPRPWAPGDGPVWMSATA